MVVTTRRAENGLISIKSNIIKKKQSTKTLIDNERKQPL